MASNFHKSDAAANAEANALAPLFNNGFLRIYSGTQPANANTALGANTLLAELRFGSPAFGAAVAGLLTANAITPTSDAAATGTATFYRCLQSDGTTVLCDGSVGTSGCDMNIPTVSIVQHATVSCASFTHQVTE